MTCSVEFHYLTMLMQYFRSVEIYWPRKKPSKSVRVVFKRFERPIKYTAVLLTILLLYLLFISRENSQIKDIQGRILNLANKSPESVKIDDNGTVHLSDGLILHNGRTAKINDIIRQLNLTNPGARGFDVWPDEKLLTTEHRRLIQEGFDEYGCNIFVSDMVGLNRIIKDNRHGYCKNKTYIKDLPKASVVVAFYNSAWSVLLRTVHSVLINSPPHLIEEIILVDDFSTKEHLGKQLDEYVKTLKKVKVLRSHKRIGVVGARVLGARNAKGPVIINIDSHVEVVTGWLEPLLDRLKDNPTLVVNPKIHGSFKHSFGVSGFDDSVGWIGGMDFLMNFVSEDRLNLYPRDPNIPSYEPWSSPTPFGPTIALWKKFFEHIGYLDVGCDYWGGDDVELGLKAWMCGGSVEMVPCSVTIHLYRDHRYSKESKGKGGYTWNTDRIAETWLDDNYKKYYYRSAGHTKTRNYGDISHLLEHKKKIGCKSFTWFVENVYPPFAIIPDYLRDEEWAEIEKVKTPT